MRPSPSARPAPSPSRRSQPPTPGGWLLHVGRPYRHHGLAGRLFAVMRDEAVRRGARRLYISATPSESALRFYLAQGARLADPPDPVLLALEPEDVHLILDL